MMAKISARFKQDYHQQIEVWWITFGDFRSIYRYISETVQDTDIIVMDMANRNTFALYRMALFSVTLSSRSDVTH